MFVIEKGSQWPAAAGIPPDNRIGSGQGVLESMVDRWVAPKVGRVKGYTLRELAYGELRVALLSGRFAPGEAITVRELAEMMQLGFMPVREGVQQLASQGALEFLPNRSVRVPVYTLEEVRKIYEARILIECYAVEQAAKHITPEQVAALNEGLQEMFTRAADAEARDKLKANYDFHFQIYEACGSSYIVEMIERLWLRIGPLHISVFNSAPADREDFLAVQPQHVELVNALRVHDAAHAKEIMLSLLEKSLAWYERHAANLLAA